MNKFTAFVALSVFCSAAARAEVAPPPPFSATKLLGKLAGGTLENVVGNLITSELTNLGVFSCIGIGSDPNEEVMAKLQQIVEQLNTIQGDIQDLQSDVQTLNATVIEQSEIEQLHDSITQMDQQENIITTCATSLAQLAGGSGSDATDSALTAYAPRILGRADDNCDLVLAFANLHSLIVPSGGPTTQGVYALLAEVARDYNLPFEQVASHFVQFQFVQREAVELIREAYSVLGETNNLNNELNVTPNLLGELRDEEIAFLNAADIYTFAGPPPYDPLPEALGNDAQPAALADAIVQRLENVPSEISFASSSILDTYSNYQASALSVFDPSSSNSVALNGTLTGAALSYYDTNNTALTVGVASCLAASPSDGFSYVRPGATGGFGIGSSCTAHLSRAILQNPPATIAANWTFHGRDANTALSSTQALRNAANLNSETANEALALGGDEAGAGTGYAGFTVIPDATSPNLITLAIDVPGHAQAVIGTGTSHAFVAGSGAHVQFTRVLVDPTLPDRYYLQKGTHYLTVGADGFAALSSTPLAFDFVRTISGGSELHYPIALANNTTGTGVLYVDVQSTQWFFGESPDDIWANNVDISQAAGVPQWFAVNAADNQPAPSYPIRFYPPCLASDSSGPDFAVNAGFSLAECSTVDQDYVTYGVSLRNLDQFNQRQLQLQLGIDVSIPNPDLALEADPGLEEIDSGDYDAGLHCYSENTSDFAHMDTSEVVLNTSGPTESNALASTVTVTLTPLETLFIYCQILDQTGEYVADMHISQLSVMPCTSASGDCQGYQQ